MSVVRLKPGHVQPLWAGHPWVYAQAIEHIDPGVGRGDEVLVVDPHGKVLGRGFYSPGSAIPIRLLVRDESTPLDAEFFRRRLVRARALRAELGLGEGDTTGYRWVHAEGDELPGLIVDCYDDVLAIQFSTAGMKARADVVFEAIDSVLHPRAIVDRTPLSTAKAEGFEPGRGVVWGAPTSQLSFLERGFKYKIPLELGQKTGFYFDQRPLRARVEELARGRDVLDVFSYTGAFALAAARGGAKRVRAIDESAGAIDVGKRLADDNGYGGVIEFVQGDAARVLKETRDMQGDLVVVDPPRFAPKRGAREHALVAYTRVAELACHATRPGGLLAFCSCSAAVDTNALARALAMGAARAGVNAIILERYFQGPDHPVPAAFPEGLYLKSLVARIDAR